MYQIKIEATIAGLMQNQHYNEYRELLSGDWTKQGLFKTLAADFYLLAPELPAKLAGLYQMKGLNAATSEAKILATEVVQRKIERDLQIMQAKWQALQNGGNMDQQQRIVVYDFSGTPHTTDYSYLSALAKDKQLLNYVDPKSPVGQKIQAELQAATHRQKGPELEG